MIRDDIHLNALMMEGWTSQTFRMAAGESQGFEDVPQEWSSSHTLSTFQKACLRTAFQSLRREQVLRRHQLRQWVRIQLRVPGLRHFLPNWRMRYCRLWNKSSSQTTHRNWFMRTFFLLLGWWVWSMTNLPKKHGNGYHGSFASRSPSRRRYQGIELKKCRRSTKSL